MATAPGNLPVAPATRAVHQEGHVGNGGRVAGPDLNGAATAAQGSSVSAATRFAEAHRALRADPSVQFSMAPPAPATRPPQWLIDFLRWLGRILKPLGDFLGRIARLLPDAPYARIFLWTVIALAAAAIVWLVVQRMRHGEWRLPRLRRARRVAVDGQGEDDWSPEAAPAREWLAEADALAARGMFAEAVHHLLFRSVEDIARRRPQLARPALTSRELAASPAIPPVARTLFADIARVVERSLFGGRAVDAGDWQAARGAYADFALAGAWRG